MSEFVIKYWPLLLPTVLGAVAVYWLLPRAQRLPPVYGAVFAGLALVAAGFLLIRSEWAEVETILFYTFAGLAVLFGGLMITQKNPVHAALSFAMVVLSTCGLFLLQAAPFLMAATIVVYAGAIVVTFLFVIMLAQQAGISNADQRSREPFLATVAGFVLLGSLLYILFDSYGGPKADKLDGFIEQADLAYKAGSVDDWQKIFGQKDAFFVEFRKFINPTGLHHKPDNARTALSVAIENAQLTWNALKPVEGGQARVADPERAKLLTEELAEIRRLAMQVKQGQGTLMADEKLPLSTSAGAAPNAPVQIGKDGKPVERLPAANVAGLGKALFTDYLLAVELAGTLLLVATIGAIAIAGRRPEGLR